MSELVHSFLFFCRRDTIVTRGDAQAKIASRTKNKNEKSVTKGTFQRQLAELKKKIKQTIQVIHLPSYERVSMCP